MTEAEWRATDDVQAIHGCLKSVRPPSGRTFPKLSRRVARLFAVACVRVTPYVVPPPSPEAEASATSSRLVRWLATGSAEGRSTQSAASK